MLLPPPPPTVVASLLSPVRELPAPEAAPEEAVEPEDVEVTPLRSKEADAVEDNADTVVVVAAA